MVRWPPACVMENLERVYVPFRVVEGLVARQHPKEVAAPMLVIPNTLYRRSWPLTMSVPHKNPLARSIRAPGKGAVTQRVRTAPGNCRSSR